jgi:5-amino-6-(5-phosphoribosylamino)uracil reductase
VRDLGEKVELPSVLDDLWSHDVKRLMVEGGSTIHAQFLQADLVDEIQLAVAPFFLGDPAAPRFANSGTYPDGPGRRMQLTGATTVGDVAVLRYLPSRTS